MALAQGALRGWRNRLLPSGVKVGYVIIIIIISGLQQEDDATPS
jgi:hypothetical protein